MSKNTKEKQRNKPLKIPTITIPPGALSKLFNINPMYLLGLVGVVIAGVSLWYQRKSYLKDEDNEQQSDDERDGPKHSTGGESNFFGPTTSDLRSESAALGQNPFPPVQKNRKRKNIFLTHLNGRNINLEFGHLMIK